MTKVSDIFKKALTATSESKQIEFKEAFDINAQGDWCEIIKDIVAISNSGGGIIVFGLDNHGTPVDKLMPGLNKLDPAQIVDKMSKYIGTSAFEVQIETGKKNNNLLVAFIISESKTPIVFEKPGTYDLGGGKQKNAFSPGTVYFRHGAKSEPANNDDLRRVIERRLNSIRNGWLKNVQKITKAPSNAEVFFSQPKNELHKSTIRIVKDQSATPVRITRDKNLSNATFVHEEISDGLFDEVNNIINANRALAKASNRFHFGQNVYFRIYAERHHVDTGQDEIELLFHNAISEFYAPYLYWISILPDDAVAKSITDLCIRPKSPQINNLIRISPLLGSSFQSWLISKWDSKWKNTSQPPSFYWTLKEMDLPVDQGHALSLASRIPNQVTYDEGEPISVKHLLENPNDASKILTNSCLKVFEGDKSYKDLSRGLDYLTYGKDIQRRGKDLSKAIIAQIGNQKISDY